MRTVLILCFFLLPAWAFSQKGKILQANSQFTAGKLDEAKRLVDEGIQHEACVDWDRAYFIKGQIYQAIFESSNKDYKKLDENALEVAWQAYQKAAELDIKQKMTERLEVQYQNLIVDFSNQAVKFYNAGNFKNALQAFDRVFDIKKIIPGAGEASQIDTALMFNTAVVALRAEEWATAEKYFKETLKYGYELGKTYPVLARALKEQGKKEESIEYLRKGHEANPQDMDILIELINYYLANEKSEEAENFLDAGIRHSPNNISFYRVKGNLYEKTKRWKEAEAIYQKILEVDSNDYVALFNLGNIKLREVTELEKKVQDISDRAEYEKGKAELYKRYEEVLPYFEKSYQLKPDDRNTWSVLKGLYFRQRDKNPRYLKKYEEFNAKLSQ